MYCNIFKRDFSGFTSYLLNLGWILCRKTDKLDTPDLEHIRHNIDCRYIAFSVLFEVEKLCLLV